MSPMIHPNWPGYSPMIYAPCPVIPPLSNLGSKSVRHIYVQRVCLEIPTPFAQIALLYLRLRFFFSLILTNKLSDRFYWNILWIVHTYSTIITHNFKETFWLLFLKRKIKYNRKFFHVAIQIHIFRIWLSTFW